MKHLLPVLFCLSLAAAPPVPVVFDTDLGNDVDDVLALAMLHALESRGEVRLIAVTITKDHPLAPRAADALNTFYRRAGLPIGMVRNGVTKEEGKYNRAIVEAGAGNPNREFPGAVEVLRQVLEKEADGSVVIIQVGFSTNLAQLLAAPGGPELVRKKVRLLSAMAGHFTNPTFREYNVKEDVASAAKVFAEWPTPVVASGFEVGQRIKYPATSIERDFAWAPNHPIPPGYRAYMKMPYDRESWDLTSVLYAVRPDAGYFSLSAPGRIRVQSQGEVTFESSTGGAHRFLILEETQIPRIREAMIWLASQPVRGLVQ